MQCRVAEGFFPLALVGKSARKHTYPKSHRQFHDLSAEDMWMTSIVDRYRNRPYDDVFCNMCLAVFVSEYRVLSKNEKCRGAIKLKGKYGFVAKRTRTQPAVVRYARFSETKSPELFHQSILQLGG